MSDWPWFDVTVGADTNTIVLQLKRLADERAQAYSMTIERAALLAQKLADIGGLSLGIRVINERWPVASAAGRYRIAACGGSNARGGPSGTRRRSSTTRSRLVTPTRRRRGTSPRCRRVVVWPGHRVAWRVRRAPVLCQPEPLAGRRRAQPGVVT
jgi:hypothetical protein